MSFYDEVDVEDMTFDAAEARFTYPCPCGDVFFIALADLLGGEEVARCNSCSLRLRVVVGDFGALEAREAELRGGGGGAGGSGNGVGSSSGASGGVGENEGDSSLSGSGGNSGNGDGNRGGGGSGDGNGGGGVGSGGGSATDPAAASSDAAPPTVAATSA